MDLTINKVTSSPLQSILSLGDNQQAITAVEKMEQTAAQLEALLKQNPPDEKAIINCYNKLTTEWNNFNKIPVSDPDGMVALAKAVTSLGLETLGIAVEIGDFSDASQACQALLGCFGDLISALQDGTK